MRKATGLAATVHSAGLAELVWPSADGAAPQALGAVPLLLGEQPALALPWGYAAQARAAAAAGTAALVLSEPRLSGPGWLPLAASGPLTLLDDGDGSLFTAQLLDQELRKHPPARALAGSPLLRREHWWYLPRLVLLLDPQHVAPVAARSGPLDAVLAVDDERLHVRTVRVGAWDDDPLLLDGAPPGVSGPAVLVGQEVSVPDAERWTVHVTTGRYDAGRLAEVQHPATRALEPVPGLLARVRRQRALERGCVRALRAHGHG
ncbi:MAG: hypothetical protein WD794_03845 [Mycobacteriales bacterium]